MQLGLSVWQELLRVLEMHWVNAALMLALSVECWVLVCRARAHSLERRLDRLLREELEAYARLDATLPAGGDARGLAKLVCRMVAEKSAFRRAALLLRDAEGRLYCAASAGMDDLAVSALNEWGARVVEQERAAAVSEQRRPQSLVKSLMLDLADAPNPVCGDPAVRTRLEDIESRAIVLPLRVAGARIAGALAVSVELPLPLWAPTLEEAMPPLEALALKLARGVENAALTERLVRVEKLAGLGQLAGGVAHELNNPLTAVLGFAEMIAETSAEPRVRDDAHTIVTEALRMKEIIQNLVNFWRPATQVDAPVDLAALAREMAAACEGRLAELGVGMAVSLGEALPAVRGSVDRLRVVLEHLLNNAAQAIEGARKAAAAASSAEASEGLRLMKGEDDAPVIRITVSRTGGAVHMVVSDTGPGFSEPTRVFDPFYTTRQPGEGSGLGLSICYGIVREHGGEISAFNLHPHGAAVVVELPVREVVEDRVQGSGSRVQVT